MACTVVLARYWLWSLVLFGVSTVAEDASNTDYGNFPWLQTTTASSDDTTTVVASAAFPAPTAPPTAESSSLFPSLVPGVTTATDSTSTTTTAPATTSDTPAPTADAATSAAPTTPPTAAEPTAPTTRPTPSPTTPAPTPAPRTPTPAPTMAPGTTELSTSAEAGQNELEVKSVDGFNSGDAVTIGTESNIISDVSETAERRLSTQPGKLTLKDPLVNSYTVGTTISTQQAVAAAQLGQLGAAVTAMSVDSTSTQPDTTAITNVAAGSPPTDGCESPTVASSFGLRCNGILFRSGKFFHSGDMCQPVCQDGYVASEEALICLGTTLNPSTYQCYGGSSSSFPSGLGVFLLLLLLALGGAAAYYYYGSHLRLQLQKQANSHFAAGAPLRDQEMGQRVQNPQYLPVATNDAYGQGRGQYQDPNRSNSHYGVDPGRGGSFNAAPQQGLYPPQHGDHLRGGLNTTASQYDSQYGGNQRGSFNAVPSQYGGDQRGSFNAGASQHGGDPRGGPSAGSHYAGGYGGPPGAPGAGGMPPPNGAERMRSGYGPGIRVDPHSTGSGAPVARQQQGQQGCAIS